MNVEDTLAELDSIYEETETPALRGMPEQLVSLDDAAWEEDGLVESEQPPESDVEAMLSEIVDDFDRLMSAVETLSGKIDKLRAILEQSAETDVEGD